MSDLQRVAFLMHVKPGQEEVYRRVHESDKIWPAILDSCRSAGFRNYSLFMGGVDGRQVFGYFETDNLEKTIKTLSDDPVNVEWQMQMSPLMDMGGTFDETSAMKFLSPIFHLA